MGAAPLVAVSSMQIAVAHLVLRRALQQRGAQQAAGRPSSASKQGVFITPPPTSAMAQVVFRPLRAQAYSDTVAVVCDGVPVLVNLSAPLAASRLHAPDAVDFGLVPARERFTRQLPIRNTGAAPLAFRWRAEAPFSVSPSSGRLAPGAGAACEVAFAPEEAAAFVGTAACELDSGEVVAVQVGFELSGADVCCTEQYCFELGASTVCGCRFQVPRLPYLLQVDLSLIADRPPVHAQLHALASCRVGPSSLTSPWRRSLSTSAA